MDASLHWSIYWVAIEDVVSYRLNLEPDYSAVNKFLQNFDKRIIA